MARALQEMVVQVVVWDEGMGGPVEMVWIRSWLGNVSRKYLAKQSGRYG